MAAVTGQLQVQCISSGEYEILLEKIENRIGEDVLTVEGNALTMVITAEMSFTLDA